MPRYLTFFLLLFFVIILDVLRRFSNGMVAIILFFMERSNGNDMEFGRVVVGMQRLLP